MNLSEISNNREFCRSELYSDVDFPSVDTRIDTVMSIRCNRNDFSIKRYLAFNDVNTLKCADAEIILQPTYKGYIFRHGMPTQKDAEIPQKEPNKYGINLCTAY